MNYKVGALYKIKEDRMAISFSSSKPLHFQENNNLYLLLERDVRFDEVCEKFSHPIQMKFGKAIQIIPTRFVQIRIHVLNGEDKVFGRFLYNNNIYYGYLDDFEEIL